MFYGKNLLFDYLQSFLDPHNGEATIKEISECAEQVNLRTIGAWLPYDTPNADEQSALLDVGFPCIIQWKNKTFAVVYKATKNAVWVADPLKGKYKLERKAFESEWLQGQEMGRVLIAEPLPEFYTEEGQITPRKGLITLWGYLKPFKGLILQLAAGLLFASLIQLIFPFLTQAVVDRGIENQNIGFIYLILLAQLMLFVGRISVSFVQSWILLHIGSRINVALISDFLLKLMKLPIGYFTEKRIGDLLQRIGDQSRIENFLTGSTFLVLFSFFNLLIFGMVLLYYNSLIFIIFFVSSILFIAWTFLFLRKRAEIDDVRFKELAEKQHVQIELIRGMKEIKLQNSERKRRRTWTQVQARLFRANIRSMSITQYQDAGTSFISQLKDILIIFIAARSVIEGEMSLGMMLAVQYMVGQLNGPLNQMVNFIRMAQDASISLNRLGEIYELPDEEEKAGMMDTLPEHGDILIEQLDFKYSDTSELVLKDINLVIPKGKVTAIVGKSGSGKTTLVKLLLGFFQPVKGNIRLGRTNLGNISNQLWRESCGAVMQDGYIFSDTIANNIAESTDEVDRHKLLESIQIANLQGFIDSLPLAYNTMVGARGNGISQGQKQRLLIARAVYKDPRYLFFDEATNALDARNEKQIVEKLENFYQGRTVVVVAHRLSTVRNADQIVVLKQGEIIETGTHEELVELKGDYFQLVRNQLELGA